MPAYRQPLRVKRKVDLKIVTSISSRVDTAPISFGDHFMNKPGFHHRGRPVGRIGNRNDHKLQHQRSTNLRRHSPKSDVTSDSSSEEDQEQEAASSPVSIDIDSEFLSEPVLESETSVLKSCHDFIPFVTIAFADGFYDPLTIEPPTPTMFGLPDSNSSDLTDFSSGQPLSPTHQMPFTHVIRILYPDSAIGEEEIESMPLESGMSWPQYSDADDGTSVSVLNLVIDKEEFDLDDTEADDQALAERRLSLLTDNQLLLARDFLCLALPYYKQGAWRPQASPSADDVHVLLTAPWSSTSNSTEESMSTKRRRQETAAATDLMAILACYLAQCSERSVAQVLSGINEDLRRCEGQGRHVELWVDRVGKEGCGFLDRMSKMG